MEDTTVAHRSSEIVEELLLETSVWEEAVDLAQDRAARGEPVLMRREVVGGHDVYYVFR